MEAGVPQIRLKIVAGASPNALIPIVNKTQGRSSKAFQSTPLVYALLRSDQAAVKLLLSHGADPNLEPELKVYLAMKPLHIASAMGLTACVQLLLLSGANPNDAVRHGNCIKATTDIVPASLAHTQAGDTALHIAVDHRHFGVVQELLARENTDVNCVSARGRTPLYKAIKRSVHDATQDLLAHPRTNVNFGMPPPLFAAINQQSVSLVQQLVDKRASMLLVDETGRSPLKATMLVVSIFFGSRAAMVEALVRAGSNPNEVIEPSTTALDYAVARSWLRVADVLKRLGGAPYFELPDPARLPEPLRPSPVAAPARSAAAVGGSGRTSGRTAAAGGTGRTAEATAAVSASKKVSAAESSRSAGADDGLCAVCLANKATHGFVHFDVVHCCVCLDCSRQLHAARRRVCMYCNAPYTTIMKVVGG